MSEPTREELIDNIRQALGELRKNNEMFYFRYDDKDNSFVTQATNGPFIAQTILNLAQKHNIPLFGRPRTTLQKVNEWASFLANASLFVICATILLAAIFN